MFLIERILKSNNPSCKNLLKCLYYYAEEVYVSLFWRESSKSVNCEIRNRIWQKDLLVSHNSNCLLNTKIQLRSKFLKKLRPNLSRLDKYCQQAGAELGQAQLKLELDLTLTVCKFALYRFGLIVIIGLILFCRFD